MFVRTVIVCMAMAVLCGGVALRIMVHRPNEEQEPPMIIKENDSVLASLEVGYNADYPKSLLAAICKVAEKRRGLENISSENPPETRATRAKEGTEEENVSKLPKEIPIENGNVIVHEEIAYGNFFSDGKSFDEINEGSDIEFTMRFKFHKDGLKKLANVGNGIQSNPMAVYHNYVMWTYGLEIAVKEQNDLECSISLFSVGPSFSRKSAIVRGGFGNNVPKDQKPPKVKKIAVEMQENANTAVIDVVPDNFSSHSVSSAKVPDLLTLLGDSNVLNVNVKITLDRKYFCIKNFMPKLTPIDLSPVGVTLVSNILSGSKPAQYDWVITVGDGEPKQFYVHGKIAADSSPILAAALQSHATISKNIMLMVSDENRFILPTIKAEDMKVILSYMYLRSFVLPNFDAFARVGRVICAVFPHQISQFFSHWEQQMIEKLEKLDRSDWSSTLPQCAAQLVSIYCSPYGAFPIAKKVAIAIMADTWNMAECAGVDVVKEMTARKEFQFAQLEAITMCVDRFRTVIGSVEKKSV